MVFKHLPVSEMTYTVSNGTWNLNPSIPIQTFGPRTTILGITRGLQYSDNKIATEIWRKNTQIIPQYKCACDS